MFLAFLFVSRNASIFFGHLRGWLMMVLMSSLAFGFCKRSEKDTLSCFMGWLHCGHWLHAHKWWRKPIARRGTTKSTTLDSPPSRFHGRIGIFSNQPYLALPLEPYRVVRQSESWFESWRTTTENSRSMRTLTLRRWPGWTPHHLLTIPRKISMEARKKEMCVV